MTNLVVIFGIAATFSAVMAVFNTKMQHNLGKVLTYWLMWGSILLTGVTVIRIVEKGWS